MPRSVGASTSRVRRVKGRLTLAGAVEPVAEAAHRHEVHGPFGTGLDLRAQPADVDVDRPRTAARARPQTRSRSSRRRVGPARMGGEQREQPELLRPEVDHLPRRAGARGRRRRAPGRRRSAATRRHAGPWSRPWPRARRAGRPARSRVRRGRSASSKPAASAASRSSTASGGARWTARMSRAPAALRRDQLEDRPVRPAAARRPRSAAVPRAARRGSGGVGDDADRRPATRPGRSVAGPSSRQDQPGGRARYARGGIDRLVRDPVGRRRPRAEGRRGAVNGLFRGR